MEINIKEVKRYDERGYAKFGVVFEKTDGTKTEEIFRKVSVCLNQRVKQIIDGIPSTTLRDKTDEEIIKEAKERIDAIKRQLFFEGQDVIEYNFDAEKGLEKKKPAKKGQENTE